MQPEYIRTTATVSHLARGTCAGAFAGKPRAGPIIAAAGYQKVDVKSPAAVPPARLY
jgi:hypothetical protein